MDIFFSSFFSVTRDLIDKFGEEIVWIPFFFSDLFNYHLLSGNVHRDNRVTEV